MFLKKGERPEPKIADLFSLDLEGKTISSGSTVGDAIEIMANTGEHCFLVQTEGKKPVGIISEHDIVSAMARHRDDVAKVKVEDVMTIDIYIASENATLDEALALMAEHNVRHLPVMSEEGRVLGFLSIMDLVMKKQLFLGG
jgi:CBS domain-containing protein